jgi:toluene monooxygenase system ferredoxin subunit
MAFTKAARLDDLWIGEKAQVVVGGMRVLLVRLDEGVFAFEDRCMHQGVALSEGRLVGRTLVCSAHAWEYDACTGRGINPRGTALRGFPVKLEDGDVLIDVGGQLG